MATKQETFDAVVAHLRSQKVRAMYGSICMYRTPHGAKCAVGCLISDDDYRPCLEGQSSDMPDVANMVAAHSLPLLMALQEVHDHGQDWELRFREVAEKFSLDYTPPSPDQPTLPLTRAQLYQSESTTES